MKKLLAILMAMALVLPVALANFGSQGMDVSIGTEEFEPMIWMCDSRVVSDDNLEWGRTSADGTPLTEREQNYAFEGEEIKWKVLVLDKNGMGKVSDVYVSVGRNQQSGDNIEANCELNSIVDYSDTEQLNSSCNARIDEEELGYAPGPNTMGYYTCTLTVEPPQDSAANQADWKFHGEYWVTAVVEDLNGHLGFMDENEFWFFNPSLGVGVSGDLAFSNVGPGTSGYSDTVTVKNEAEDESGVQLDMFITGTDFYDLDSSGAKCPTSNVLSLSNLKYFATNGAYSSQTDGRGTGDTENYVGITVADHFDRSLYTVPGDWGAEILQASANQPIDDPYYGPNILTPGSEMSLTFRLDLPVPCNGDFSTGRINFWGEAV